MSGKKEAGLKSAFDLAMERLEKKDGKAAVLSDEQKKALHEVDRRTSAKVAEIEILMQKKLSAPEDAEEAAKIEEQMRAQIVRARADGEREKDGIRRAGSK